VNGIVIVLGKACIREFLTGGWGVVWGLNLYTSLKRLREQHVDDSVLIGACCCGLNACFLASASYMVPSEAEVYTTVFLV